MEVFKKHTNHQDVTVVGRRSRWVNIKPPLTATKYRQYDRRGAENRRRRYISRHNKIKINNIQRDKKLRARALQQRLRQVYGI
jgi:hypothetical protein